MAAKYSGTTTSVANAGNSATCPAMRRKPSMMATAATPNVAQRSNTAPDSVPVRIVFKPSVPKWNLLAVLVRTFRNRYRFEGTGIYHISAQAVRDLKVERALRTLDNPQPRAGKDRAASMRRLAASLRTRGYDESKPINIQICRTGGRTDSLRQGHHRISACLACGVDRITVHFSAAGALPRGLGGNRE